MTEEERNEELPPTEPETEEPSIRDRRSFLGRLMGMAFLTAGIAKVGGKLRADEVPPRPPVPADNCRYVTEHGYSEDADCGSAGDATDNDCGYQTEHPYTSGHQDFDCRNLSGQTVEDGRDQDCGIGGAPWTNSWADNDCGLRNSSGGNNTDQDCGKLATGFGTEWSDGDCASSGSDNACGFWDFFPADDPDLPYTDDNPPPY